MTVSIIIEWANALLADLDRARRMLRQLAAQSSELQQSPSGTAYRFPFEVLICYDSEKVDAELIEGVVEQEVGSGCRSLNVRLQACPGAEYYQLKTLGAEASDGEILLFVDSDVVPEPRWLQTLLGAMQDPRHQVVAGTSYVELLDTYHKAFALHWVFALRDDRETITTTDQFWANNVAFRRELFFEYGLPPSEGASRGACKELCLKLESEGITIYEATGARVRHPAPDGGWGFVRRALAQGRDRVLWHKRFSSWFYSSFIAGLLRLPRHIWMLTRNVVTGFRKAEVKWYELPAVYLIGLAYYIIFMIGELLAHLMPKTMLRNFRV